MLLTERGDIFAYYKDKYPRLRQYEPIHSDLHPQDIVDVKS